MFIRRTQTRSRLAGGVYFTHRLVRNERVNGKVRQVTLLNLGREFEVAQEDWPLFCVRLTEVLSLQPGLQLTQVPMALEQAVRRYAARLQPRVGDDVGAVRGRAKQTARSDSGSPVATAEDPEQPDLLDDVPLGPAIPTPQPSSQTFEVIDVDSLDFADERTVGVEALALHAIETLGITEHFRGATDNRITLAAAIGQIVARMAHPASELSTHRWLQEESALGELLETDYAKLSLSRLYRVADVIWAQHERLEPKLYQRIQSVCGLDDHIALYDLTNTYFEGLMPDSELARRGHSKEKRSDALLITLGLVLDGNGFVRRSEILAGNIREASTLQAMLTALKAPTGALVIMDRGFVDSGNLSWLREQGYRYLVMSKERLPLGDAPASLTTANNDTIQWQLHRPAPDADDQDLRLACYSEARASKERAMVSKKRQRFEATLTKMSEGLAKPRAQKALDRIHQRLGRLRERYPLVARHYQIDVDAQDDKATAIRFHYVPKTMSKAAAPGYYVLRSNAMDLDGEALWRTYVQLTDVEAAFRSLKSELGLRPIYHQLDRRCKAHLWISVLAYQCVQYLRRCLAAKGITLSWDQLRKRLCSHQRATVSFRRQDGAVLHVRKAGKPKPHAQAIYQALGLNERPGGIRKRIFRPERDL